MTEPIKPQSGVTPPAPAPVQPPAGKPGAPGSVPPAPAAGQPTGTPPPGEHQGATVPIAALHEERAKRQQLQSQLEELQRLRQPQYQQPPQPQPQQPQSANPDLERLWETDPRRAVQAEIFTAFTWYDQLNAQLDSQESQVASQFPDYDRYRNEVRNYVRTLPIQQRMDPRVYTLAYYAVRGQKVDDLLAAERAAAEAEMQRKWAAGELVAGSGGPGGIPQTPQGGQVVQLNEEEQRAASAMGISPEDYLKWRKR